MILKVWLQILIIFIIACGPLFMLEYFQHEETLQLTLNSGPTTEIINKIPFVLNQFRESAVQNPQNAELYQNHFYKWFEIQKSLIEWDNLKPIIHRKMQKTSFINALFLLIAALSTSLFVARSITKQFEKLLKEKTDRIEREGELKALSQWQATARSLVHELRGPLTPVKLVTSSLFDSIDDYSFDADTRSGVELSLQKIQQMELMIEKFMSFAKLPEVSLRQGSLTQVIKSFIDNYAESFSRPLQFINPSIDSGINSQIKKTDDIVFIDEDLIHSALYNLINNAAEAMKAEDLRPILLTLTNTEKHYTLVINNQGSVIPENVINTIFQVGSSSKLNNRKNFGIGLAMAKKIMLDHNGDLILAENSIHIGVSFKLHFPHINPLNMIVEK